MISLLLALGGCRGPTLVALPCDPYAEGAGESALVFDGARPRNVLMISLDTLRRDRVGRYGGSAETDFLDRLLSEGVALDDHRSCSNWTYPSMLCALTGQGPIDLGFMPATSGGEPYPVPEEITFMGDWMRQAGYSTALVTASTLIGSKFGFSRAYDTLVERPDVSAEQLNELALTLLDGLDPGEPWFVHLHYMDPHIPYTPPDEYLGGLDALAPIAEKINLKGPLEHLYDSWSGYTPEEQALYQAHLQVYYDGELAYLDDQLERLLAALEVRGLLDDALVVLYSDHGEQFWDHGEILHHRELFHEESDALALFWARGLLPARWQAPTTHADLLPTVLEALDLSTPAIVSGAVVGSQDPVCARFAYNLDDQTGSQSVDYQSLRMIYDWDGTVKLYDRRADPAERDALDARPEDALLLWSFLSPEVSALGALHPDASPTQPDL